MPLSGDEVDSRNKVDSRVSCLYIVLAKYASMGSWCILTAAMRGLICAQKCGSGHCSCLSWQSLFCPIVGSYFLLL